MSSPMKHDFHQVYASCEAREKVRGHRFFTALALCAGGAALVLGTIMLILKMG